jgi:hypothetical protein
MARVWPFAFSAGYINEQRHPHATTMLCASERQQGPEKSNRRGFGIVHVACHFGGTFRSGFLSLHRWDAHDEGSNNTDVTSLYIVLMRGSKPGPQRRKTIYIVGFGDLDVETIPLDVRVELQVV